MLTNLNLAEWKGFAPTLDASGRAHATLRVTSKRSGQQVGFDMAAAVENLAAKLGSNAVDNLQIRLTAQGEANNGQQVELSSARLSIAHGDEPAATLSSKAALDLVKKVTRAELHLDADFPRLLRVMPQPGISLTSGTVQLDGQVNQQNGQMDASGTLAIRSLTGTFNGRVLTDLGLGLNYDAGSAAERDRGRAQAGGGDAGRDAVL